MNSFDLTSFYNSDGFSSLDDEAKGLIKEFAKKLSAISPAEAMPVFMQYNAKLNKKVGQKQRVLLMDALKMGLSETDRKKMEIFERFMQP